MFKLVPPVKGKCCSKCSRYLDSRNGYACFECIYPPLGTFQWLTSDDEAHRDRSLVLKCHPDFETWMNSSKIVICCAIRSVGSSHNRSLIWTPYTVDSCAADAVFRIADIPRPCRSWSVMLHDSENVPVSFFLDLESYQEDWSTCQADFLEKVFNNESKSKNKREKVIVNYQDYFNAETQMWIALEWIGVRVSKFLGLKKMPVQKTDWWIYCNDRRDVTKKEEKWKLSRRAYLPHVLFPNLRILRCFMKRIKEELELTASNEKENWDPEIISFLTLPVERKIKMCIVRDEEEKEREKEKEKEKESTALYRIVRSWMHYIDFSVYNTSRKMRFPTCVKSPSISSSVGKRQEPLQLLQVGSKDWYWNYLAPRSSKDKNKICSLELEALLRNSLEGDNGLDPLDDRIQLLSGLIVHPLHPSNPRPCPLPSDPEFADMSLTVPSPPRFAHHFSSSLSSSLSSKASQNQVPSEIVELALSWLRSHGDLQSMVKPVVTPNGIILQVRAASTRQERKCWSGATHGPNGNGGYFAIRLHNRVPGQGKNTKGVIQFFCLSPQCSGVLAPSVPFCIPTIWRGHVRTIRRFKVQNKIKSAKDLKGKPEFSVMGHQSFKIANSPRLAGQRKKEKRKKKTVNKKKRKRD